VSIAKILSLLSAVLACGVLYAAGAQAQLAPPYVEYAAKFTCGQESANEGDDVVAGVYATSINIHNPQARLTVNFIKKIVVARRENGGFVPPLVLKGALAPDQADRVDCPFIVAALKLTAPYVEGFIVLEVPPLSATANIQPVLDVVAKYTARGTTGGVSTQSVVPVAGKSITN
jgi:hypothetical protein